MTTFSATSILSSAFKMDTGVTAYLDTLQLRYPRVIHPEFMTHRRFSRNASSSRAIPVRRQIEDVERDPYRPIHWGKNRPGMQAWEELTGSALEQAQEAWEDGLRQSLELARRMENAGAHKQLVNRILEPFAHINVVVTSSEWANFLGLRDHPDAEPHIAILAREVRKALEGAQTQTLLEGEWHLPYLVGNEDPGYFMSQGWGDYSADHPPAARISAARCARVSYLTHEGKTPEPDQDFRLFNDLMAGEIKHASPCEHQAMAKNTWDERLNRNLGPGWVQFRAMIYGDTIG